MTSDKNAPTQSEAGKRLIAGAKEALAVARGEEPAASITVNGHRYVPAAEITRLQKELETAREALEPFATIGKTVDAATIRKPDEHPLWGFDGAYLTYGDVRRAAAVAGGRE